MHGSIVIIKRLRQSWRKTWKFNYRGWNFFEAVITDDDGKHYLLSVGAMGNKFLSISTAWIATEDNWYFINKNFFNQVSHHDEKWRTSDGHIESYYDPECGFEILADSEKHRIDLRFIPNPDLYFLNKISKRKTDYELLLCNHCEVKGYISIDGEKKRVKGIGSVEHFFGRFSERIHWDYFSLKDPDISVYFRTGRIKDNYLNRTVAIYTRDDVFVFENQETTWQEVGPNQIQATAVQDNLELKVTINFFIKNPENEKQPYINVHIPPFKKIYADVHEWCANIEGEFTANGITREFSGKGICHITEANW